MRLLILFGFALTLLAQAPGTGSLRGVVKDPSGSVIPNALVDLQGPRAQRAVSDERGEYSFAGVPNGRYQIRVGAQGFAAIERRNVDISGAGVLNFDLAIATNTQAVDVSDGNGQVSADVTNNANAVVFGEKQLDALSDDPAILQQQLAALAGGGPDGGQIYVDGFSGASLPSKASIQEIRINSNPYSPENDLPGGMYIQIITKPGANTFHGQLFSSYNKEALNSRSPLLTQSKRPQYKSTQINANVSGAIKKEKASYSLDFYHQSQIQNSFIYATTLDSALNPVQVNQTVLSPNKIYQGSPRIDYLINPKNTLMVRYNVYRFERENAGVGDFTLESRGYTTGTWQQNFQVSETATISARMVMDTRVSFNRARTSNVGDNSIPAISVQGAFSGGGAQIGNSGRLSKNLEINNSTSYARGTHTLRFGARLRKSAWDDTSVNNFGGSYSFQGGAGPALDLNNAPVPGTRIDLTALEVYRRTLLFQRQGLNDAQIRALGGGAFQFNLSAGQPTTEVGRFDAGVYFADDWRARRNFTMSYGLRYENQTLISDHSNFAPRVAIAWNIGKGGPNNQPSKTVLRAATGIFFGRIGEGTVLNALRFDGVTQQSYLILNPSFFPTIPSPATLASARLPQQIQYLDSSARAAQIYQATLGVDRQINKFVKLSFNYNHNRQTHLLRPLNINAPINGVFPFGDAQIRIDSQSTGLTRTQNFTINPSINYKRVFLAGYYSYSRGMTDAEGQPADPYNLHAEWGPASYADTRHRMSLQTSVPLPWKVGLSLAYQFSSAPPYNITVGHDLNGDSIIAERPGFLPNLSSSNCLGGTLVYKSGLGCLDLNPAPGTAVARNYARGVSMWNVAYMSVNRSWVLNKREPQKNANDTITVSSAAGQSIQLPANILSSAAARREYTVQLSINAQNPLNHTTYTVPSGDLSSPFFGAFRTTGSGATYNRRVDIQLRLSF